MSKISSYVDLFALFLCGAKSENFGVQIQPFFSNSTEFYFSTCHHSKMIFALMLVVLIFVIFCVLFQCRFQHFKTVISRTWVWSLKPNNVMLQRSCSLSFWDHFKATVSQCGLQSEFFPTFTMDGAKRIDDFVFVVKSNTMLQT